VIHREFKLQNPYNFAAYLRVSDPTQNTRSPEQQHATIQQVIRRCASPWREVKVYRDDGIKGRFISRRPGFQQMLREIAVGLVQVDLIVVDTYERFGRADEFAAIRQTLMKQYGVLIVSADTNFADPTGPVGRAVGMMEQMRATEEGRVKAHNVIRGKKDTLRLKRWPGGPVPFGYRLKKLVDNSGKEPEVYSVLEPDPGTAWIIKKVFQKAFETGWGDVRLAKFFNGDTKIPVGYKPFNWSTIGYWLRREIYIGVGVWGENCTDIIDDARVIEPNPHPEEIERVENFCEPLISLEVFDAVKAVRKKRADRWAASRSGSDAERGKLIQPMASGISLSYPLSGLVKCGEPGGCGGCMVARPSGRKSKTGTTYTYYVCPRYINGACANQQYVHERRLWAATVSCLRKRLFPLRQSPDAVPSWFGPLVERVRQELHKLRQDRPRRTQDLEARIRDINQRMSGWRDSLGKQDLSPALRRDLERDYEMAAQGKDRLEAELVTEQASERQLQTTLDPGHVLDAVKRLDQVLGGDNITEVNIELAQHIECIECFRDGRAVLRGADLGPFEGAVESLNEPHHADVAVTPAAAQGGGEYEKVLPRRLTRRKVNTLSANTAPVAVDVEGALDARKFAGLAEAFVWEESLVVSRKISWAEEYADEVLKFTDEHPNLTQGGVAQHFGKSRPTIRQALKIARTATKVVGQVRPKRDADPLPPQDPADSAKPQNQMPPSDGGGDGKTA